MVNEVSGNRPPQMDPDAYAIQYAKENGISLEDAKAQLRSKFGDPNPPSVFMANGFQFSGTGKEAEINPWGVPTDDPEKLAAFVKNGAKKTGMDEKEFAAMSGLPPREEKDAEDAKLDELQKLGIPKEVIKKGDDAIRKYAHDHNINLPPKEKR